MITKSYWDLLGYDNA